jgi:tRNA(fMet)-specific endonuclease VapC
VSADEKAVAGLLEFIQLLNFSQTAASHCATIRTALKKKGTMIGANDLQIAAHARSLGLILVTNNTREFRRVPKLSLQNWTIA